MRPTIYGNYVAHAVSRRGAGPWHIQGDEPDLALCGKRLTGDLHGMNLHASLLECSRCMELGANVFPACCPDCARSDLKFVGSGESASFPRHKIAPGGRWCRGSGRLLVEPAGLYAMYAPMGG